MTTETTIILAVLFMLFACDKPKQPNTADTIQTADAIIKKLNDCDADQACHQHLEAVRNFENGD